MDLDKLIEKSCRHRNEDNELGVHDRAYERALRDAYIMYGHIDNLNRLKLYQQMARENFRYEGSTHRNVAKCIILQEMINEIEDSEMVK